MLTDKRILIVEDQSLIAQKLADALEDAGASVVGSAPTIVEAISIIAGTPDLDGALLDVNLGGEMSYPVAYDLLRRKVPFVFLTAYDPSLVAARFRTVPIFEKPVELERVLDGLRAAIDSASLTARSA